MTALHHHTLRPDCTALSDARDRRSITQRRVPIDRQRNYAPSCHGIAAGGWHRCRNLFCREHYFTSIQSSVVRRNASRLLFRLRRTAFETRSAVVR